MKNKVEALYNKIEKIHAQIEKIQNECPHPEEYQEEKYGANTGNYDPSCDCYYKDVICKVCNKRRHYISKPELGYVLDDRFS